MDFKGLMKELDYHVDVKVTANNSADNIKAEYLNQLYQNMATGIGFDDHASIEEWLEYAGIEPPYEVKCAGCSKCTPQMRMDELTS